MPPADPSVIAVLTELRRKYEGVPFLALGQNALWDEPMKAAWLFQLNRLWPDAVLIAGVHDTDYFGKTSAHLGTQDKYVSLEHDDGQTRDLWSAAGEISELFGSESVPTRQMYLSHGIPFDWLARRDNEGKDHFFREKTPAWGWRGLVSTDIRDEIAHDVKLDEIRAALLGQTEWAIRETEQRLERNESAGAIAQQTLTNGVRDMVSRMGAQANLTELYCALLPWLYRQLLGDEPMGRLQTDCSLSLFAFNKSTCARPRFRAISPFLDPVTAAKARAAYNEAVAGSGIYALDSFGPGAIPFDVVIPGRGRGTLCVNSGRLVVETSPNPIRLSADGEIGTVAQLAARLESEFGSEIALVGKAVTLINMIAAEFILVFHETASGYTGATRRLNDSLAQIGVVQELHPIARLEYPTWDALAAVPSGVAFRLPDHLERAFGRETIPAREFAERWRSVVDQQRAILTNSSRFRKPREILTWLEGQDEQCWCGLQEEYEVALRKLREIGKQSRTLGDRIADHRRELAVWRAQRLELERRKGNDWRRSVMPLRKKLAELAASAQDTRAIEQEIARQIARRAKAFDEPLADCRDRITASDTMISHFRREMRILERSEAAMALRRQIENILLRAQRARLEIVRNAFLTVEGLTHTHLRPTAWWLPMVDPSGAWFQAIAAGMKARLEPVTGE